MNKTNLTSDQAATKIQSLTRGHLSRKAIQKQNQAATVIQTAYKKGKALINQENTCPITYDTIKMHNSTLTTCGHVFNTEALSSWLERSAHCPSCRATIAPLPNQPVVEPNNGGELSQLTHLPDNLQHVGELSLPNVVPLTHLPENLQIDGELSLPGVS